MAGVLIVAVRLALAVAVVVVGPGRAWIRTVVGMIGHTLLSAWALPQPGLADSHSSRFGRRPALT